MDYTAYRESVSEQQRTDDLMRLIRDSTGRRGSVLDVGARDGHFSLLLAEVYDTVTALDLETPVVSRTNVTCVKGDVTQLDFDDNTFDLVFCAEVLEHIPTHLLEIACHELGRVSNEYLIVGVPYQQDIRVGRTTCPSCGQVNPPWGHVNSFDQKKLMNLFPQFESHKCSYVGENNSRTNSLSTLLMDLAGNPYGTYQQEEPCIHCGSKLGLPPERAYLQKVLTRAAFYLRRLQSPLAKPHPSWVHLVLRKKQETTAAATRSHT